MVILDKEDRQIIKSFIRIGIISIIIILVLTLLFIGFTTNLVGDTYASIVGCLIGVYPQEEENIVKTIKEINQNNKEIGYEILSRYEISVNEEIESSNISKELISYFLPIYLLLGLLIFVSISLIFWRYIKQKKQSIQEITDYFRKLNGGDYSLDIRDNREGNISILKNEIYKTTVMLKEQKEQLIQDKVALSNSISDISHQLKTPLTSITIMNDLLYEELPTKDKKEFLDKIHIQLERMQWLVTTLLNIAKFDAGIITYNKKNVYIQEILHDVQRHLDPYIKSKDITIEMDGDANAYFLGDYNWSLEGLINIIKNCIDHLQAGGQIKLKYLQNQLFAQIIIKDSGFGIAKKDLPHIFNRFYRGKNAKESSAGIGLYLSKMIFNYQNGEIFVQSIEGKGTTFTINIYRQI